ncbi:hypothetical protein MTO96_029059 [Rhipicephalus appendiculatus]
MATNQLGEEVRQLRGFASDGTDGSAVSFDEYALYERGVHVSMEMSHAEIAEAALNNENMDEQQNIEPGDVPRLAKTRNLSRRLRNTGEFSCGVEELMISVTQLENAFLPPSSAGKQIGMTCILGGQ